MGDKIDEETRYTDEKIELTEDVIEEIDRKIQRISETISENKTADVIMTWFIPDLTKEGGMYRTDSVTVKKIDEINRSLILTDGTGIPIRDITNIS